MLTLVIDTSTERSVCALISQKNPIFELQLPFGLHRSQSLFSQLQQALQKAKIGFHQIQLIAVAVGPGSYTGIRIGAIAAKAWGLAAQIPIVGICTLDGFIAEQDGPFAAVIDAKIGGLYWQTAEKKRDEIHILEKARVTPLEEAVSHLIDIPLLVTPNAQQLRPAFQKIMPSASWQWQECYPSTMHLASLAIKQYEKGRFANDGQLDLLYMRKTQAEIDR